MAQWHTPPLSPSDDQIKTTTSVKSRTDKRQKHLTQKTNQKKLHSIGSQQPEPASWEYTRTQSEVLLVEKFVTTDMIRINGYTKKILEPFFDEERSGLLAFRLRGDS